MPVPTSRGDLSISAGDNSPGGSEVPFPGVLKNYLRTIHAFIAQNFADITTLNTALTTRLPAGVILMWSGSVASIPSGWVLCDGSNGTPDLRSRFVVGAGSSYAVAATGGAASAVSDSQGAHTHTVSGSTGAHTLTVAELPAHTHALAVIGESGVYGESGDVSGGSTASSATTLPTGGGGAHSHDSGTLAAASGGAHTHTTATLPPYYALAYIQKT